MTLLYIFLWLCGVAATMPIWEHSLKVRDQHHYGDAPIYFFGSLFLWPLVIVYLIVISILEMLETKSVQKQLALKKAKLELKKVERELEGL